jgi:endonuclease/exonuclease/phosphatase family metal-dependent hydrolase
MRSALFLLFLAAALGRASAAPVEDSLRLRVMTFNIRYANPQDGDNRWEKRRDLLFRSIREYDPDIFCLQEALKPQLDDVLAALPAYTAVGVGRDDGITKGEYAAILYRSARFAAGPDSTFWLSDTPQVPGSKSWGNNVTRICTFVELTDQGTMQAVYVFNTHLDHESQQAREKGVELICSYLDRYSAAPFILTGDFNAGQGNAALRKLLAPKAVATQTLPDSAARAAATPRVFDSYRALHGPAEEEATYHAFEGGTSGEKIDFILLSRSEAHTWRVLSADIVRAADRGRYPSDHFPVTTTVAMSVPRRWRGQKH